MFTGHDGPTTMNVYWSVAIFTSDRTSRPVVSSLPVLVNQFRGNSRSKTLSCRKIKSFSGM